MYETNNIRTTGYHPSEDSGEKKDLEYVYRRIQEMKDARRASGIELRWDKWQKQYDGYRVERKPDEWQSNIVVNTTAGIVESQLSEAIDQNYRPRYLPRGIEDKPRATVMNAINDYTWEVGMADVEVYKMTSEAFVLGTSIGQEYYRKEKRIVQQIMSTSKDGTQKFKEIEINDFDDVYLEHVRLQEVWFDPYGRGLNGTYAAKDCVLKNFSKVLSGIRWTMLNTLLQVGMLITTNTTNLPRESITNVRLRCTGTGLHDVLQADQTYPTL